jgi:hypothetical protein
MGGSPNDYEMMPKTPPDAGRALEDSVPLSPNRTWDLPAGPRLGRASALRVPCSEGPASYELTPVETPPDALVREEPSWDPARMSELGTDWSATVCEAAHALERPVRALGVDGTV